MRDDVMLLRTFFWLSEAMILALAMLPVIRFLIVGWPLRRLEFVNRLATNGRAEAYMRRFWNASADCDATRSLFLQRYDEMTGRRLYLAPAVLLALLTFTFGGLVIQSAERFGYEAYVTDNRAWHGTDGPPPFTMPHLAIDLIDRAFRPFPPTMFDFACIAAVAGAYLFVVGDLIQGNRSRSLVPSDLMWSSLRLAISIPMGLSLGGHGGDGHSLSVAFVGFSLGAFPIFQLMALLRRIVGQSISKVETEGNTDQLIAMLGVTPATSAVLQAEGISSAQQLSDQDPVSMALRTGLSFDYVMNLVAQSQAWSFIGVTAGRLAPLGLADARTIARLVDQLGSSNDSEKARALATLADAEKTTGLDKASLETGFRNIAEDDYTGFLRLF